MNWKFFLNSFSATLHFFVVYNLKFEVSALNGHEVFAAVDVDDFALGFLVATRYDLNEVSFYYVPPWNRLLGYFVGKHSLGSLEHRS